MKIATTKGRIIEYIDNKGIKLSDFYSNTGLKRGLFDRDKLDQSISDKFIAIIIERYRDLNLNWLITGKGEMLQGQSSSEVSTPIINYNKQGNPYYNVDFTGSFDLVFNNQSINPDYFINFEPFNINNGIWCNLSGKSMEPEINNGDKIIIREVKDWKTFLPLGEIYGIVTDEFRTVKRVGKSPMPGYLRLIPANPAYDPQDLPITKIIAVYQVIGAVKMF